MERPRLLVLPVGLDVLQLLTELGHVHVIREVKKAKLRQGGAL